MQLIDGVWINQILLVCWFFRGSTSENLNESEMCKRPSEESEICTKSSEEDVYFIELIKETVNDNECCHKSVCNGDLRIVENVIEGLTARVIINYEKEPICEEYVKQYYTKSNDKTQQFYAFKNHWPSCFPHQDILWTGDPEDNGLTGTWDYLPLSCQIVESLLVSVILFLVVVGIIGSLILGGSGLNLCIRNFGSNSRDEAEGVRTMSLVVSTLIVIFFGLIPGLYEHITLMTNTTTNPQGYYFVYNVNYTSPGKAISDINDFVASLTHYHHILHLLMAIALDCAVTTLIVLWWTYFVFRAFNSKFAMKKGVICSWLLMLICSLPVHLKSDDAGALNLITKIPEIGLIRLGSQQEIQWIIWTFVVLFPLVMLIGGLIWWFCKERDNKRLLNYVFLGLTLTLPTIIPATILIGLDVNCFSCIYKRWPLFSYIITYFYICTPIVYTWMTIFFMIRNGKLSSSWTHIRSSLCERFLPIAPLKYKLRLLMGIPHPRMESQKIENFIEKYAPLLKIPVDRLRNMMDMAKHGSKFNAKPTSDKSGRDNKGLELETHPQVQSPELSSTLDSTEQKSVHSSNKPVSELQANSV